MLPGPVTRSTGSMPSGESPYARSAIDCAPPTAYTSSTPSNSHAARIAGCGNPANSFCGGEHTAIELTPATCAGTTFMTTLDGYTARPPGTYSPTRDTGTHRSVTVPPG